MQRGKRSVFYYASNLSYISISPSAFGSVQNANLAHPLELMVSGKSCMDPILPVIMFYSAVAILAILRSETNAFPLSTVVVEQYRPPIDKFVVGM